MDRNFFADAPVDLAKAVYMVVTTGDSHMDNSMSKWKARSQATKAALRCKRTKRDTDRHFPSVIGVHKIVVD